MNSTKKMLNIILVFFLCSLDYDVIFKIINKLKVNNNNSKFNDSIIFKIANRLKS